MEALAVYQGERIISLAFEWRCMVHVKYGSTASELCRLLQCLVS